MEELKELKALLADELDESFRRGIINNMPRIPMAVIYMDEDSRKAKEEIDPILQHIWGERKNAIVQMMMDGDSFCDVGSGVPLNKEDIQELIDDMYASDNSFRDMSRLCIVMLHCTASCMDVSEFQTRYERIHQVEEFMADGLLTTSIVLLDESTKCRKTAADIRSYLGGLLDAGNSPYASTFLLSNRLSNGSLLAGKRMNENYSMAGWILLLLNGVGAGYSPDLGLFYPAGREYYLTAAFSEINRPNDRICDIVLHAMLMWIDRHVRMHGKTQSRSLDIEELYQRLEIAGGKAKFLEDFFQTNIADQIPTVEDVKYLPRRQMEASDIASKDFQSFNQETMGGCSALLAGLSLFGLQMKDEFVRYLQTYVQSRLTAAERERTLTASNVQEIIRCLCPEPVTGKERVGTYLYEKIHEDYLSWALPVCEEYLRREQKKSASYAKEFEDILLEFQQGYFPDDAELERYYADITNNELERASSGLGERMVKEISMRGGQREAVLDCLKRTAQEVFSAHPVFSMPLEQEMISRMGQNPNDIHNQIYNTLFRALDNRIRLKTTFALSVQKQVTIINQRDENGAETELYQSIRKNISDSANMIYFDSCSSNTIKIIRFYRCDKANLI